MRHNCWLCRVIVGYLAGQLFDILLLLCVRFRCVSHCAGVCVWFVAHLTLVVEVESW